MQKLESYLADIQLISDNFKAQAVSLDDLIRKFIQNGRVDLFSPTAATLTTPDHVESFLKSDLYNAMLKYVDGFTSLTTVYKNIEDNINSITAEKIIQEGLFVEPMSYLRDELTKYTQLCKDLETQKSNQDFEYVNKLASTMRKGQQLVFEIKDILKHIIKVYSDLIEKEKLLTQGNYTAFIVEQGQEETKSAAMDK